MNSLLSCRLATGFLVLVIGRAAAAAPLLNDNFENDAGGFQAAGQNGAVSVTHDAANVKDGNGALKFDYQIAHGEADYVALPIMDGQLAGMKSLDFWVKTDGPATLALGMQEKGGGRYTAMFSTPKGKWQEVRLRPEDFILSLDGDAPKDPDNKLDLDQVGMLAVMDVATIFAQADNPALAKLLNIKTGGHTMYLDSLVATADAPPAAAAVPAAAGEVTLDDFSEPQVSWITLGSVAPSISTGQPLNTPALQADYHQGAGTVIGLIRPIHTGVLKGMDALAFKIASQKAAQIVVQVEETDGGKYNTVVLAPEGGQPRDVRLSFADFTPADDSKDTNNTLDLDKIKQVMFLDASGLLGTVDADNTLWIGSLRATPAAAPANAQ